jgi:hypothetical protein
MARKTPEANAFNKLRALGLALHFLQSRGINPPQKLIAKMRKMKQIFRTKVASLICELSNLEY